MTERCPYYKQFHSRVCSMPQRVCFRCGQTGHIKKYYILLSNIGSVGQLSVQPSTPILSFSRSVVRPIGSSRSMAGNSSRTQGVQRSQGPKLVFLQ